MTTRGFLILLLIVSLCCIASSDHCTKIIYVFVDAEANKDYLANILPPEDKAQIYAISTGTPGQDRLADFVGNEAHRSVMKDPDNIAKMIGEFQAQKCVIGESNPKMDRLPSKKRTKVKIGNKIREKKDIVLTLDSAASRQEFEEVRRLAIINLYTRSLGGDGLKLHLVTNIGNEVQIRHYLNEEKSLSYILEISGMMYDEGTKIMVVEILKLIKEQYDKFSTAEKAKAELLLAAKVNQENLGKIKSDASFFANGGFPIYINGGSAGMWLDLIPSAVVANVADMADAKTDDKKEKWDGATIMVLDGSGVSSADKVSFESARFHINHLLDTCWFGAGGMNLNVALNQDGKAEHLAFNSQADVAKYKSTVAGLKFSASASASTPDMIFKNLLQVFDKVHASGSYNRKNLVIEIPAGLKPPTDKATIAKLRVMATVGSVRLVNNGGVIAASAQGDLNAVIPNMRPSLGYLNHGNNIYQAINDNVLKKQNKDQKIIKAKTDGGEIFIRPSDGEGGRFRVPASELDFKDQLSLFARTKVLASHEGTILGIRGDGQTFEEGQLLMEIKGGKLRATVKTDDGKTFSVQSKDDIAKGWRLLGLRINCTNGMMGISTDGRLCGIVNNDPFKLTLNGNMDLLGRRTLLSTAAIAASDIMSFMDEAKARVDLNKLLETKKYEIDKPIPTRYHNFFREEGFGGYYFINTNTFKDNFMVTNANVGLGIRAFTVGAYFHYAGKDGAILRIVGEGQGPAQAVFGMKISGGKSAAWFRSPAKKYETQGSVSIANGWHFGAYRYDYTSGTVYLTLDGALVGQGNVGTFEWMNSGDLYAYGMGYLETNGIFINNNFMALSRDKEIAGAAMKKWLEKYGYTYHHELNMQVFTLPPGAPTESTTTAAAAAPAGVGASHEGSGWFKKRRRRRRNFPRLRWR
ncbi:uncharacterized protein LOC135494853 [Lineus longissimus]|uniref:uncharacterized protein LOC135494853 n=1 Tax=Lineus longissimus TaxID=88925 RepID=UPI00315C6E45